jgi:hypothetical protein
MINNPNNLIIIEKYNEFVNYIYPVLQNIQRKHGIIKERILLLIFEQVELFYKALKSNQKSRLYEADANLASIRYYLRFLADRNRKLISQKQHHVASIKIAEVGKILNSWIKGK